MLITDDVPDPKRVQSAVKSGMFLLPRLLGAEVEDGGVQRLVDEMTLYPMPQSVALWSIGEHLGHQRELAARKKEVERVRDAITAVHEQQEELGLATATVEGEFRLYARSPSNLDVIGVDLPIWGTSETFEDGLEYLRQRQHATARSNAEAVFWAWLPAAPSQVVTRNIWGTDAVPPWGTPPVQPDQLRLMTYMALAGGCRGLSFLGDANLTRPDGEPLLLEMNFLNAEIDLFEQFLARTNEAITDKKVFDPDPAERPTTANVNMKRMPLIKEVGGKPGLHAISIPLPDGKGIPDAGGRFRLGGRIRRDLAVATAAVGLQRPGHHVPDAHGCAVPGGQPGRRPFPRDQDRRPRPRRDAAHPPGLRPDEHDPLHQRPGTLRARPGPGPAHPAPGGPDGHPPGRLQLALVRETHQRLKDDGHELNNKKEIEQRRKRGIEGVPIDADGLLAKAEEFIRNARTALESEDYATAWAEARRAGRPMRHLMAGYWRQAMSEFREAVDESFYGKKPEYPRGTIRPYPNPPIVVTGASCPAAISFYTLPAVAHLEGLDQGDRRISLRRNRVPPARSTGPTRSPRPAGPTSATSTSTSSRSSRCRGSRRTRSPSGTRKTSRRRTTRRSRSWRSTSRK